MAARPLPPPSPAFLPDLSPLRERDGARTLGDAADSTSCMHQLIHGRPARAAALPRQVLLLLLCVMMMRPLPRLASLRLLSLMGIAEPGCLPRYCAVPAAVPAVPASGSRHMAAWRKRERGLGAGERRRLDTDAATCLLVKLELLLSVSDAPVTRGCGLPAAHTSRRASKPWGASDIGTTGCQRAGSEATYPSACCCVQVLSRGLLPAPVLHRRQAIPREGEICSTRPSRIWWPPRLCNSAADQGKPTVEAEQPSGEGGGKTRTDHTRSHQCLGRWARRGKKRSRCLSPRSLSLMSWAGCLSYRSQWEFLFPSGKERQMGRSKLVVCVILFFSQRSSIVLSNARRRWGVEELVNGGGE